jgi:hypothetical protein
MAYSVENEKLKRLDAIVIVMVADYFFTVQSKGVAGYFSCKTPLLFKRSVT